MDWAYLYETPEIYAQPNVYFQMDRQYSRLSCNISPYRSIQSIIDFLHFELQPYTEEASTRLIKVYHFLCMVLSRDFAVEFRTIGRERLIAFVKNTFNLHMNSDKQVGTTQTGIIIDTVFQHSITI